MMGSKAQQYVPLIVTYEVRIQKLCKTQLHPLMGRLCKQVTGVCDTYDL